MCLELFVIEGMALLSSSLVLLSLAVDFKGDFMCGGSMEEQVELAKNFW